MTYSSYKIPNWKDIKKEAVSDDMKHEESSSPVCIETKEMKTISINLDDERVEKINFLYQGEEIVLSRNEFKTLKTLMEL